MRFPALLIAVAALWLIVSGCSKNEDSPFAPAPATEVAWLTTLPNLVFSTTAYYPVQVQVLAAMPQAIDSVHAVITTPTGQSSIRFRLYDDAGYFQREDALDFCSPYSGDLVANNGVFTRQVSAQFADTVGLHYIKVAAWINNESAWTPQDTILVALSLPPQWSSLILPDTLYSGFPPLQINVSVFDPDAAAGDSVASVQMSLYSPLGILLGDPADLIPLDQSHFGQTIGADFAVGRQTGFYTFAFRAWDTFAMISDSLGQSVYMENLAPHLSGPIFALGDTIILPSPGDTTYFPISVRCWDDQTLADILEVHVQAVKPDLDTGSVVELFDDGEIDISGDSLAGDSIFTRIISIWPSNLLGAYAFHFRGLDQAENQNEIVDTLWVVPQ
jgi:hypothetical protein